MWLKLHKTVTKFFPWLHVILIISSHKNWCQTPNLTTIAKVYIHILSELVDVARCTYQYQ